MSVSRERDIRDAFECAIRKRGADYFERVGGGVYVLEHIEESWQEFLRLGVDVLAPQGRA